MADYDSFLPDDWDSNWDEVMSAAASPCECPTAPRQFLIPPPPPPPAMGLCGGSPLGGHVAERAGGYFCRLEPIGAEFTQAGFPSLPVIAVCSSIVVVAVLVASFLIWRHKTKVQNLLPCKHEHHQPGHCDLGSGAGPNGVTYEDVLINHHPTRLPLAGPPMVGGQTLMPIELLDVKLGDIVPPEAAALHPGSFYPCRDTTGRITNKPFHPMYEEISREPSAGKSASKSYESDVEESGRGGRSFTSEDDFAEDELSGIEYPSGEGSRHCSATSSVQGSTGGDLCKDPVSSDDAAGEDSDYPPPPQGLPGLMAPESSFDYPRKQLNLLPEDLDMLPNSVEEAPRPVKKPFHAGVVAPPPVAHSSIPDDCKQNFMMPTRGGFVPTAGGPMAPPHQSNKWSVYPSPVCTVLPRDSRESLESPVENIYSTIDEGDVVDSGQGLAPNPSRSHQGGTASAKIRNPVPTKKQAGKLNPPGEANKRYQDEESESYGDIMPAYDSTSCIT